MRVTLTNVAPLVVAQEVSAIYAGEIHALERVSCCIPAGQFVSIVGPSGCGKSTLLRLIAGLLPVSDGELTVAGKPPAEARRHGTPMSFVFQDATLLPWRRVLANVALPLELERSDAADDRAALVSTALERVGLSEFAERYPAQLSGGMRMRVAMARALVTNPRLILLDEPFAALDDLTRFALNDELLALWRAHGWTAVFVTHNIAEAVYLSERVLVMSRRPGRVVADIAVPFAAERDETLRTTPEFAACCATIAAELRKGNA